jgi:hypothetical protein
LLVAVVVEKDNKIILPVVVAELVVIKLLPDLLLLLDLQLPLL